MCSKRGRLSSWEDRTAAKAPYTCPPQFGTPRSPSPSSHPRSPPTRRHRRLPLLAKCASAAAARADCRPSKTPTWCSPYSLAMRFRQWPSPNPFPLPSQNEDLAPTAKPYPTSCASHIAVPLNSLLATSTTTATMGNSIQTLRPRMRHYYCRSPRVPSSPACSSLRHRSNPNREPLAGCAACVSVIVSQANRHCPCNTLQQNRRRSRNNKQTLLRMPAYE